MPADPASPPAPAPPTVRFVRQPPAQGPGHHGHAHGHGHAHAPPPPAPAAPHAPQAMPVRAARAAPLLALALLVPAAALALVAWAPGTSLLGLPVAALGLAAAAASADLVGGYYTLRRKRLQDPRYLIAFSSGIVVAAVFFELLPHAFEAEEGVPGLSVQTLALVMAAGFFLFYLAEKLIMLHSCGERECTSHTIGPVVVVGMALDNVVDGVGIAVGFLVDPLLGVVITLAVMAHEIPQGITSAELLTRAGFPARRTLGILALAGAAYLVGAAVSGFIPESLHQASIAFVAGSFIYVGASDLLAEAHRTFNARVVGSVVLGAAVMYGLSVLEGLNGAVH